MHEEVTQVAKNRSGESEEGTILCSTQTNPERRIFFIIL